MKFGKVIVTIETATVMLILLKSLDDSRRDQYTHNWSYGVTPYSEIHKRFVKLLNKFTI